MLVPGVGEIPVFCREGELLNCPKRFPCFAGYSVAQNMAFWFPFVGKIMFRRAPQGEPFIWASEVFQHLFELVCLRFLRHMHYSTYTLFLFESGQTSLVP